MPVGPWQQWPFCSCRSDKIGVLCDSVRVAIGSIRHWPPAVLSPTARTIFAFQYCQRRDGRNRRTRPIPLHFILQSHSSHVSHFADRLQSLSTRNWLIRVLSSAAVFIHIYNLGHFSCRNWFGSDEFCRNIWHTDETIKMQCQTPPAQPAGFPCMALAALLGLHWSDVAGTTLQ